MSNAPAAPLPQLVCVDPASLGSVWLAVAPFLRAAIERTGLGLFDDLRAELLGGPGLVWIAWNGTAIEAAASTVLRRTENGLVCVVTACGGLSRERWLPLLSQIEDYARAEGCRRVRITGRKGWAKALDGYLEKHVILEKELT